MVSNLDEGFEAWLEQRRNRGYGRFLKDKRRRLALLQKEVGPVTFTFGRGTDEGLDYILTHKRAQLVQSGQHDIFECGWTEDLLRNLLADHDEDFGARMATLRAGGKIIAAEIGLRSARAYHLWFPVYDADYGRYSPGQLMTLETLRAASEQGITRIDFGAGGEDYKAAFADPADVVFEGDILASPARAALANTPGLRSQRIKLGRRLDRIIACETGLGGQARALGRYAGVILRRQTGLSATASLGGAIGLAMTMSAE